jgi:2-dehydropantoate 2-reductase
VGSATVSLGEHLRLEPLVEALRIANFRVEVVADTESLLWGKLVVNSAINPLTALLRLPNGELLTRPAARSLMGEVAAETARVAAAQGIVLPYSDAVAAVEAVAQRTAENISSMLRDVQRDAPTEIEAINGAIVRAGEQVGVSTPLNRTLWQLVSSLRSL